MNATLVICRHCNNIATVIDPAGGPRFAWCEDCRALYHSDPRVRTPRVKNPRVKKSPKASRSTSKKSRARKPKEP